MIGRTPLAILAAVACLSPMPAWARDETISKSEIRAEPPNRTHARLRDVVWDMFEAQDYRRDQAPTRALDSVHLRTRTHATRIRNLCRYDLAWIEFDKAGSTDSGADTPVKAVALTTASFWSFVGPPPAIEDDWWEESPVSVEECAALPDDAPAFTAVSELEALEGTFAWTILREAIARGDDFPLECNRSHAETRPCAQIIAEAPFARMTDIRRCTSSNGGSCYRLTLDDQRLTIDFNTPVSGNDPHVTKVTHDALIVIRDEAID